MFAGILAFEWRYHTRQLTFVIIGLVFAGLAGFFVATGYGPPNVHVNSPYVIAQSMGLLSLFSVFFLTIFCATAALRDRESGMAEIIFSTPVGKWRYLTGRFVGAMLAATTVMAIAALVLMFAALLLHVEPERMGPIQPLAYVWALLVLVLPNLLLVGAILFSIAVLSRSTLATYIGALGIYAAYLVTALLVDSPLMAGAAPATPEGLARAAIFDPFGLSAFFEQTRYWTAMERNTRFVALAGNLLLNRLLWTAVALAICTATYVRFEFRVSASKPRAKRNASPLLADLPSSVYAPVVVSSQPRTAFRTSLFARLRLELRHLLGAWTFRIFMLLWVFVAGMQGQAEMGGGEYGTHVLPTTGLLLGAAQLPLLLLGTLGIIYYAADIAWRERIVKIDPLVDATPVANAALYLAKATAVCAIPAVMAFIALAMGLLLQAANPRVGLDPALAIGLLWYSAAPLVVFAIGALAIQVLAPNRWVGLVGGLMLGVISRQGESLGLEYPMLRFAAPATASFSDMDRFGPMAASFAAYLGYWVAAAAIIAALSWGMWQRGADTKLNTRIRAVSRTFSGTRRRSAIAASFMFVAFATALFWQTSVAHAWESRDAKAAWRADYERAYRSYAVRPQPSVIGIATNVDLFPDERRARITGRLLIENRAADEISTILVNVPSDADGTTVTMDSALVRRSARFGAYEFELARPLRPGQRAEIRYSMEFNRGGIRGSGFSYDIAANGTVLTSSEAVPGVGYRAGYELRDPATRRRYGLTAAATEPALLPSDSVSGVSKVRPNVAWLTLDATISTSSDQTAITSGQLVRAWTEKGRRFSHYVTQAPVTPVFVIVSGRYAMRHERLGGVNVSVWYHPAHGANVDTILHAARTSLALFGSRYGPYQYPQLHIIEVPSWSNFGALALPGIILLTEDRGFRSDPQAGDVDLVTRRIAHEVSHQWWPHRMDPADVDGGLLLVETLAKNAEQLVIADMHGQSALSEMLAFDEDRYFAGRTAERDTEPPLVRVRDQEYLYYGKGAVVMNGLRELLGAAAVDSSIVQLLTEQSGPTGSATSMDLMRALLAHTSASQSPIVREWLTGRMVYDLRVDTATVSSGANGSFHVNITIAAVKGDAAADVEVPVDGERIDLVLVDEAMPLKHTYATTIELVGGRAATAVDLPFRPTHALVDPMIRRLDRQRSNNSKSIVQVGTAQ